MAGYSGTPLANKLGLKPGARAFLHGLPTEHAPLYRELQRLAKMPPDATLDLAHIFTTEPETLAALFSQLARALADDGMVWISWPKKSSGRPTRLDENIVRALGLDAGLVDVKVCAVDEIWSGLKFVRRLRDRKPAQGKRAAASKLEKPKSAASKRNKQRAGSA